MMSPKEDINIGLSVRVDRILDPILLDILQNALFY